jgi:hypothetical protein
MFNVVKKSTQSLSDVVHQFDEKMRDLILNNHDEDSDEELDGEFSKYKTVARSAFASPSALASRLGKRGGVPSGSCDGSGVSRATSRRCKGQFQSDPNSNQILKEILSATTIKAGQTPSLHELDPPPLTEDAEESETFFDDEKCAVLTSFQAKKETDSQ